MAPEERFQSFRRGLDSRLINIEAYYHEETGQHLVDWDDILEAFPSVNCIMNGPNLVPRARDNRRKFIEPRCIKYHHGIALEVIVGDVFTPGVEATSTPPPQPIQGTATPGTHLERDTHSFHSRTESTSSSILTVDTISHTQNNSANTSNREQGRNHSEMDYYQKFSPPFELPTPMFTPQSAGSSNSTHEQQQWTTSAARGSQSGGSTTVSASSENTSYFPPWHTTSTAGPDNSRVIGNTTQDNASHSTYLHNGHHPSSAGLHTPSPTIATAIVRVEQPTSSTQSKQFMERMQATVLSFEQFIREGQLMQAKVVQREAESIKQEMAQYYGNLQNEVAKNTTLQNQLRDMMVAEQTMTKRILDLQEAQLDTDKRMLLLQQQALDRLALIHSKATAILTQTYELHEFPIPRLFIILPKEDITKREKISTLFVQRFRLYFLCECGEHTRPVDGPPSSLSHDIHLARHEGYDLDRPNEFFRKYGSYVLALLQMIKYGVAAAGMVVPPLNNLKVADGLEYVEEGLKAIEKGLAPRVDSAIEYLQGLTASQDGVSKDLGDASSTSTLVDPVSISRLEGLEGADLRHLGSFLKARDESKVLGNLYRTVTPKGHVKWVCLDHYRESYGAAALQEFKETVELNGGTYDQRTGRVTMRLASPILARQFYTMLLSTRLVHELELTLDWNTAFEDLRTLKGVVQQSNVFHLSLDLRGKTGPTSDFVYRNRRAEPIVQIMASGKVHTMTLKNTTGFLPQTKELLKTTLHVRHFDLGEMVGTADDFIKLEKLIRASPTLLRLGVVVGDIDGAFARLKPLVARHKALSTLDLALRDGTAVSVRFEQGSDKIGTIGLRIVEPNVIKLMQMPMVISVAFLAKYTAFRASDLVQMAIRDHRHLKVVEIVQLPDGTAEMLQDLQRAIDLYSPEVEIQEGLEDKEFFTEETTTTTVAATGAESVMTGSRFTELDLRHRRSLLWDLVLLVASVDDAEGISEETPEETPTDALVASSVETHKRRSIFTLRRQDTSLASVQYEVSEDGANSAVLHVNDFDASEACQQMSATGLALFGGAGFELFRELTKDSTTDLSSVRTLEFGCMPGDLFAVLTYVQQVAAQHPTLSRLNLWNFNDKTMRGFDLPLRDLNLLDQSLSVEQLPSLQTLLYEASTLSRVILSIVSLSEAFVVVNSISLLHKQLSRAVLVAKKSRLSAQFTVGTGNVESISLRIHENELGPLLMLPNVTELDLGFVMDRTRINQIADSVMSHYRHLRIFKLGHGFGQLLSIVNILNQTAIRHSVECRMVLVERDVDAPRRKERVLELPLKALDIASYEVDDDDIAELQELVQTRPMLQKLSVAVASIEVAELIYELVVKERMPMATLSFRHQDASAEFSLETASEEGPMVIAQKVTHADLEATFFLPKAELQRVDIIGTDIHKPHAAEIATNVMRHCCDVGVIRFVNFPNEVQDVAAIIKDYIQYGSYMRLLERNLDEVYDSNTDSSDIDPAIEGAGLAVYCVLEDDDTRDGTSSDREDKDGRMEAIGLDWADPDGVTLLLRPVAFKDSDVVRLPDVTDVKVSIGYGSLATERLVYAPLKEFPGLKRLELPCQESLNADALLAALDAAYEHPTLEKIQIWHVDRSPNRITYSLPITTLDLSWYSIPADNIYIIQQLAAFNPSLSVLTVKVRSKLDAFKFICSNVGYFGSITELHLHDARDGSALSVWFKPGGAGEGGMSGGLASVMLSLTQLKESILMWDVPLLKMMTFSEETLELVGAVQVATEKNPSLQSLVFKDAINGPRLTLEMPFRKIDIGKRVFSLEEVTSFKKVLMACPHLTELSLMVDSVSGLQKATMLYGAVFRKYKTLMNCCVKLENGTEASIRYADKFAAVDSVALRTSDEFLDELAVMPSVKKLTIRPKDTNPWRNADHTKKELARVLRTYLDLETLEFDCGVSSPFPALFLFQTRFQKNLNVKMSPRFRRYRHRTYESKTTLISHDLPLCKLDLGDYFVSWDEFSEMKELLLMCPQLVDLAMSFPSVAVIDPIYNKLCETTAFGRLLSLNLRSWDGYGILVKWAPNQNMPVTRLLQESGRRIQNFGPSREETTEFHVSGVEWPLCFQRQNTIKLTILPKALPSAAAGVATGDTESDSKNSINNKVIQDILSEASLKCRDIKHLVLVCPVDKFFDFLTVASSITSLLSLYRVTRIDLQTLVDNNDTNSDNNNNNNNNNNKNNNNSKTIDTKAIVLATSESAAPSPVTLISTTLEKEARTITVHLENMSDQVLLESVRDVNLYRHWMVTVTSGGGVGQTGEEMKIEVMMDRSKEDKYRLFDRLVLDTKNVSVQRVFGLLDRLSNKRWASGDEVEYSYRLIWRAAIGAVAAVRKEASYRLRPGRSGPELVLLQKDHPEATVAATALAKIVVRRATELDLEYEAMKALIPFVKAEVQSPQNLGGGEAREPFSFLKKYDVTTAVEAVKDDDIMDFRGLISKDVEFAVHDFSGVDLAGDDDD
ncbi:hypothetical protein BGZ88_001575 [Linnemannia elongata]|nr:hypothetical protein BGZ88_001575 [Linnemannia elongata]